MRSVFLVFLVVTVHVNAGHVWLKDLISSKGWDLGYGVVLKLNEGHNQGKNVPILQRLSLDFKLGDLLGVGKPSSDGIELDFYVNKDGDFQEGRRKKDDNNKYMMPMVIGYKAALAASAMFAIMKMLTLKALFVAKAALIISLFVLILKLNKHHSSEIIEVEQHGFPSQHSIGKDVGANGFYGTGGGYGGDYVGGYQGGYGGELGNHNFGKEAQSSNTYSDVAYAPSASGNSEQNSGYTAGGIQEATQAHLARKGKDFQRKRDTANFQKFVDRNLLAVKKYVPPET